MFHPIRLLARKFSCEVGQVLRDGPELIHPLVWRPATVIDTPSASLLQNLSSEDRKHLEYVQKEIELFSRLTPYFPSRIDNQGWEFLIKCESRRQRLDHVVFMARRERLAEKDQKKRLERAENRSTEKYDWKTMVNWNLARVDKEIKRWASIKEAQSYRLQDRPSLAVDCRFLEQMSPRAANLTGTQIKQLVSSNRYSRSPWPLYFVNYDPTATGPSSIAQRHLSPFLEAKKTGLFPITTTQNYTSLFPKEKIIYLSPHAEEELDEMREDDVLYVIGGIVDRVREKGIHPWASRVTAEADGVRCAKFPLDRYVKWTSGTKYLTLTAVANIIHDVHATGGDWEAVLTRHIPVRNTRLPEKKNRISIDKHSRIREFNYQLLTIVEEHLPQPKD